MLQSSFKSAYKSFLGIAVFILFVSRILVLTNNYTWPIDPVLLEIIYLFFVVFLVIAYSGGRFVVFKGKYLPVLGILLVHTVLWGLAFVDSRMTEVITSHFKSQIMFVIILFVTIWATLRLEAEQQFLKCSYYALALIMCIQFITNISEVDLSNLANIFTAQDRTRANFGFGHYNGLGSACACIIVVQDFFRKQGRNPVQKLLDVLILIMAAIMLLCCASRSAITGLILYFIFYYGTRLDQWNIAPVVIRFIKVVRVFVVILLMIWALFGLDTNAFLVAAQRAMLFEHTLPTFFSSGKVLLGWGYATNPDYAYGYTPYTTYWMDNSYVYYLVTTGVVGLILVAIGYFILAKHVYSIRKTKMGAVVFATFVLYTYISLFEISLFDSGYLTNYLYLPWFFMCFARANKEEIWNG